MGDDPEEAAQAVSAEAHAEPEEPSARERRKFPRFPCEGRAEVSLPYGGLLVRGRILDVSVTGCFIEARSINLERGTPVEVFFETRKLQFRVAGNVMVIRPRVGVGIRFRTPGVRLAVQIRHLLEELSPLPSSAVATEK